jgi:hypothetical protein
MSDGAFYILSVAAVALFVAVCRPPYNRQDD